MVTRRWLAVMLAAAAVLAVALAACTSDPDEPAAPEPAPPATEAPAEPGSTVTVELAGRPFQLHVPESYDPAGRAPLVVALHGFTASGAAAESYFGLGAESDRRGFLYAMPDGTANPDGDRFWNANEACCDFYGSGVDDAGYLRQLIDAVIASYPVDTTRVYLIGHSNGGFMAHRMACEHAAVVTAIVSFAGAATSDPSQCEPARPVGVLQIHGTGDAVIAYGGGDLRGNPFPPAEGSVGMWRELNGCTDEADATSSLDLDADLPGAETTITPYTTGCRDGATVALWSIEDGSHVPALTEEAVPAMIDFLYEHAAPA